MILYVNEDGDLKLTEKALMIKEFRRLRDYAKEQYNVEMISIMFSFLHSMYDYDSHFLWDYPDEVEREEAVRNGLYKGKSFRLSKTVRDAMALYKTLYDKEQVSLYITMRNNNMKLKKHADLMTLATPIIGIENLEGEPIPVLVDSKEFMAVTAALPVMLEKLEEFEIKLKAFTKNKIDVYGGGDLGIYE